MSDMDTNFASIFRAIHDVGPDSKKLSWNKTRPLMIVLSVDLKNYTSSILKQNGLDYVVSCKSGSSGKWSYVPYCAILSKQYNCYYGNVTPTRGIFPAYLINPECSIIYLTYLIGVGTKNDREINKIKDALKKEYTLPGFIDTNNDLNLDPDLHNYQLATIWHKTYNLENLPSSETILNDFIQLIMFHDENGFMINKIAQTVINSC